VEGWMDGWVGGWIDRYRGRKPGIQIHRRIRKIDSFQSFLNLCSSVTNVFKQIMDAERKSARKDIIKNWKRNLCNSTAVNTFANIPGSTARSLNTA
jgi:hypothetical protein